MSSDTPSTSLSSKRKRNNENMDPIAEFKKLKSETDEITTKLKSSVPFLNPSFNTTNYLLGMVFGELKIMRQEMKEIKENAAKLHENVSSIKIKQQNQEELLKELKEKVSSSLEKIEETQTELIPSELKIMGKEMKEMKDNGAKLQEDVTSIKLVLNDLMENQDEVKAKQANFQTNISALKCRPTIRDHIFGKWRSIEGLYEELSAKVKKNTFMIKWISNSSYEKYTLGVKHENGITSYVENNKIVQRDFSADGEESMRNEFYFENGILHEDAFKSGQLSFETRYERIGDPDPE